MADGETEGGDIKGALVTNEGARFVTAKWITDELIGNQELLADLEANRKNRKM
jgi:hypothetical protein